jgi:hypothetical protein
MPPLFVASFSADVTPPIGHPLCGGWIEPVKAVDDPLKCLGVVLLGSGRPVVLAALDWCTLQNEAYRTVRHAVANAAHTTPDRVAVHCVHQHNAPMADTVGQATIAEAKAPISLDVDWFDRVVRDIADAVRKAVGRAERFTHVGYGQAEVKEVASARRVLGPDGKVKYTRTSATKSAEARAQPEGRIDPLLRTLSLWDGDTPRAALHFYATHPMSYYGDGRVTSDFVGLARAKRQAEQPAVFQVYFTGAAGDVTAGKYNDGAKENRAVLRDSVHAGMVAAWEKPVRFTVSEFDWRTEPVKLGVRPEAALTPPQLKEDVANAKLAASKRNTAAYRLAWHARQLRDIELASLSFGDKVRTLHLPGEPFVEYQLAAQRLAGPTCVAGYGDGGPWYIPPKSAFVEGGYEPGVAFGAFEAGEKLTSAITALLKPEGKK